MGRLGTVFLFMLSLGFAVADSPAARAGDSLVDELMQERADQDAEDERIEELRQKLPELSYEKSRERANQLGERIGGHIRALINLPEGPARTERMGQAKELLEVAALLSLRIDPNDRIEERKKAHIAQVEKARRPIKVLIFVANIINTAADLVRFGGGHVDPLRIVEESRMEPYKVGSNEWDGIFAQEFLQAVFRAAGVAEPYSIQMMPGVEGALKARETLLRLIAAVGCNPLLSTR